MVKYINQACASDGIVAATYSRGARREWTVLLINDDRVADIVHDNVVECHVCCRTTAR